MKFFLSIWMGLIALCFMIMPQSVLADFNVLKQLENYNAHVKNMVNAEFPDVYKRDGSKTVISLIESQVEFLENTAQEDFEPVLRSGVWYKSVGVINVLTGIYDSYGLTDAGRLGDSLTESEAIVELNRRLEFLPLYYLHGVDKTLAKEQHQLAIAKSSLSRIKLKSQVDSLRKHYKSLIPTQNKTVLELEELQRRETIKKSLFDRDELFKRRVQSSADTITTQQRNEVQELEEPDQNRIRITNFSFGNGDPVSINIGDTVTWTNVSGYKHSIVADFIDGGQTAPLNRGDSFHHTFTTAGVYKYRSGLASAMKGEIRVVNLAEKLLEEQREIEVIKIINFTFGDGNPVVIPRGKTIRWINDSNYDHNIVAGFLPNGESGILQPNTAFEYTFYQPGTYEYSSSLSPNNTLYIIVTK